MISQKVTIKNPTGLHIRPAGAMCDAAQKFKSQITFQHKHTTANAKSVLSVLAAGVKCGDEIEIICQGEDEEEALNTMLQLIDAGFSEWSL